MKRIKPKRLRDRRTGVNPYKRRNKRPYKYPFGTGTSYDGTPHRRLAEDTHRQAAERGSLDPIRTYHGH